MRQEDGSLRTDVQITLIEGDADSYKLQATQKVAAGWLGEELEYGLVQVDARDVGLAGVLAELGSGSLMATRRMVVVRDVTSMSANDQKSLAATLKELPAEVAVTLVARKPPEDSRRDGPKLSQTLRNLAKKSGQALKISGPGAKGLDRWAAAQAEKLGKRMGQQAAHALVETAGEDVDRLLRELEKLATYVGDEPEITEMDVLEVTSATAERKIWDFLDAIGERDAETALKLLDGMLPEASKSGDAIGLLGSIARQLRILWQVRLLHMSKVLPGDPSAAPPDVIAKLPGQQNVLDAVKGREWLLRKYSGQARKFSDADLARAIERLYTADLELKGQGSRQDHRTIMEMLVADLCTG